MITLCEKCRNNDWRHNQDLIDAFKAAGLGRGDSIWCAATDRPEDLHFEYCPHFSAMTARKKRDKRMNEHQRRLMDKPSIETPRCAFCGRPLQSRHHIVPRSQGGTKGPTVTVCGNDNVTGCHGLLHHHMLYLDWDDSQQWWKFIKLNRPTKMEEAMRRSGWLPMAGKRGA